MRATRHSRTTRCAAALATLVLSGSAATARAQEPLTLAEAMSRARRQTPEARALDAGHGAAEARVREAAAGYWPRVDLVESVQRGNAPVFVFSSLLSQRRFTARNFEIESLNHPDAITNHRTGLSVEGPVFDAGATHLAVERARIGRDLEAARRSRFGADLALRAADAFVRMLQFEASHRASLGAGDAAAADLERARARRDAGLATDADVLAVEVHLADVHSRTIAAGGELAIARLELLEAIGEPLDASISLVRPTPAVAADAQTLARDAGRLRPERLEAELSARLAGNARRQARAGFLPRVMLQGGWDFNGDAFTGRESSWMVGAQVQLNLFRGFGDQAHVAAARQDEERAAANRAAVERRIDVEVRAALARLETARAREAAGRAALDQARESYRIIRDRYESGLATITDVLRANEAALGAESRLIAAETDVILQTVALDRAAGRL